MQLFLDSVLKAEILYGAQLGIIRGVTTNPSLLAREADESRGGKFNCSLKNYIQELCSACPGLPISVEVTEENSAKMVQQGRWFTQWSSQIVVKIPMTFEGIKACNELATQGIAVNVTLCFSLTQALLAAEAGATYVSVFWGRLEDDGQDPFSVTKEINWMFSQRGLSAQLLIASLRNKDQVRRAALTGAPIATIPLSVFKTMFQHPLTDQGLEKFRQDSKLWADHLVQTCDEPWDAFVSQELHS